jgi:DNA-binding response OmpR family regulator
MLSNNISNQNKKKILIVEDEAHIAEGLRMNLVLSGYDVQLAADGVLGLETFEKYKPDMVVLDLMMPNMDGFAFLKKAREKSAQIPILVLTAKGGIKDKVRCFKDGADDYLAKPFELEEFLLRVQRLLVRSNWNLDILSVKSVAIASSNELEGLGIFKFGSNRVDFTKNEAFNGKESISLTVQEVKILQLFVSNIGKPLSRKALLENGLGYQGEIATRTVDNFIVRFRKYFEEDPKDPVYFKSLRSVGYVFNDHSAH